MTRGYASEERTLIRRRPLLETPVSVRVAPFWYRSVANLIDLVPLATVYAMVLFATGLADISDLPESRWNTFDMFVDLLNQRPLFFLPPVLLFVGMVLTYYLLSELVFGQTVGKRLLNLTIVDRGGERPVAIMTLVRNLIRIPGMLLLGLGYLWAAFDTERRTAHDWVSGTWVIFSRRDE